MKKIITLLLAIVAVFSFTACGGSSKLYDMDEFGYQAPLSTVKNWINEPRSNDAYTGWYKTIVTAETSNFNEYEETSIALKIVIKAPNKIDEQTQNFEISLQYEYDSELLDEENSQTSGIERIEVVCVNGVVYCDYLSQTTWYDTEDEKHINKEEEKIVASLKDSSYLLAVIHAMREQFSFDVLKDTIAWADESENYEFYLSDNYIGYTLQNSYEGFGLSDMYYFELEAGSKSLLESRIKSVVTISEEGYEQDISTQYFTRRINEVVLSEPADKDSYKPGEIPEISF